MNKLKKIGLTALSASLVAISAQAGETSVSGSAKMATEGHSGENRDKGTTFSMGNQLTFSGSGELENGLNVSLSFVLDQADADPGPFDSHSVSVGNDTLGTLKFVGEGGSTASNQIDATAAGDMWDAFDGMTYVDGAATTLPDLAQTASAGDNAILYTSPELVDGLTLVGSYQPQGTSRESGTGYGINYSGIEGLSVHYANTDIVGDTSDTSGDNVVIKASYAYGPITVAYSNLDHDATEKESNSPNSNRQGQPSQPRGTKTRELPTTSNASKDSTEQSTFPRSHTENELTINTPRRWTH
jgi:outer membrane protein OmpU